jgi:hypothetical protein
VSSEIVVGALCAESAGARVKPIAMKAKIDNHPARADVEDTTAVSDQR